MKPLHILFLNAVFIFLVINILNSFKFNLPTWITFYVNDFLCMPVVLTICLKILHYLKKDNTILLPLLPILSLSTFYAFYFEWYLPQERTRYTGDWVDVFMYFGGALLFYGVQFIRTKKKRPKQTLSYKFKKS